MKATLKKFRRKALDFLYELSLQKKIILSSEQEQFAIWNAHRLDISLSESRSRLIECVKTFRRGLSGGTFRDYCDKNHIVFAPFFGDSQNELIASYQFHAPLHFLRMLGYQDPTLPTALSTELEKFDHLNLLDVGCGLAQFSRKIAAMSEKPHKLYLHDIPTIRKDYLIWACKNEKLNMSFLDSQSTHPSGVFPSFNVAIVTEFFEHVPNPLEWLKVLEKSAEPRAILVTNIEDHANEFMHVSPNLNQVRERLKKIEAQEILKNKVYILP